MCSYFGETKTDLIRYQMGMIWTQESMNGKSPAWITTSPFLPHFYSFFSLCSKEQPVGPRDDLRRVTVLFQWHQLLKGKAELGSPLSPYYPVLLTHEIWGDKGWNKIPMRRTLWHRERLESLPLKRAGTVWRHWHRFEGASEYLKVTCDS